MAVKISAGDLKWSVVLKKPVPTRNSEGGKELTYETVTTVRAKVEETPAYLQGSLPALLHTDTVYFRYAEDRKDITDRWLLVYNGQEYTVNTVEVLGREKNSFIKVIAKRRG